LIEEFRRGGEDKEEVVFFGRAKGLTATGLVR